MAERLNFSLTQLEYVLALHRFGHFAKAAKACHVTQPTLSMQIQKLEEQLGAVLFDRSKKPILLTDVGRALIDQIQVAVMESRKIGSLVRRASDQEPSGELSVGVIPTLAPYVLPRVLPLIEKRFPKITLVLNEMQTHQIVSALQADEIDAGILATPLGSANLIEIPVFYEPFVVLGHRGHPLLAKKSVRYPELTHDDLWLLSEGHCLRGQVLDLCELQRRKNPNPHYRFESGNLETLKNLVDAYGGYTLLPTLAADRIGPNSKIVPFRNPAPGREVGVVYLRKHYKAPLIQLLAEAIRASMPKALTNLTRKDLDVLPVES